MDRFGLFLCSFDELLSFTGVLSAFTFSRRYFYIQIKTVDETSLDLKTSPYGKKISQSLLPTFKGIQVRSFSYKSHFNNPFTFPSFISLTEPPCCHLHSFLQLSATLCVCACSKTCWLHELISPADCSSKQNEWMMKGATSPLKTTAYSYTTVTIWFAVLKGWWLSNK